MRVLWSNSECPRNNGQRAKGQNGKWKKEKGTKGKKERKSTALSTALINVNIPITKYYKVLQLVY
jgi:hypothetical protein